MNCCCRMFQGSTRSFPCTINFGPDHRQCNATSQSRSIRLSRLAAMILYSFSGFTSSLIRYLFQSGLASGSCALQVADCFCLTAATPAGKPERAMKFRISELAVILGLLIIPPILYPTRALASPKPSSPRPKAVEGTEALPHLYSPRPSSPRPQAVEGTEAVPLKPSSPRPSSPRPQAVEGTEALPLNSYSPRPSSPRPQAVEGTEALPLKPSSPRPSSPRPKAIEGTEALPLNSYSPRPSSPRPKAAEGTEALPLKPSSPRPQSPPQPQSPQR
jgi:hypothetical protein